MSAKIDLWLNPGNHRDDSPEPDRSGCPKGHMLRKELQNWENCARCSQTKTDGSNALSEWRACIL